MGMARMGADGGDWRATRLVPHLVARVWRRLVPHAGLVAPATHRHPSHAAWAPLTRRDHIWRWYRVSRVLFVMLWVLARERGRVMREHAKGNYGVLPDAAALRHMTAEFRATAAALGGVLIKLGQFLSARPDLLPQEALDELARLQDELPPVPFDEIAATIEHELQTPLDAVFSQIERIPAGSASLGQVHRARLRSGLDVAVKVQRPRIEHVVLADLAALRFVFAVVRALLPGVERILDTRALYHEFSRTLYEELDYRREGHNVERFARLFESETDVVVPHVRWEHTTRHVLTLTWVDGIKVSDVALLDAAGVNRRAVAERLARLYLAQVLEHGLFHADPHPGNIFVRPTPDGFTLALVDFGMVGSLSPRHKRALGTAFAAIARQDAPLLADALEMLGVLGPGANRETVEYALGLLVARFTGLTLGEIRDLGAHEILDEVRSLIYGQPFRLPAEFAFLGRAAGMLSGLLMLLAPEFNLTEVAVPYAREIFTRRGVAAVLGLLGVESVNELGRVLARESLALARSVSALPRLAEQVLRQVENGHLRFVLDTPDTPGPSRAGNGWHPFRALGQPVPAWVPLGMLGATGIGVALWRRIPMARGRAPHARNVGGPETGRTRRAATRGARTTTRRRPRATPPPGHWGRGASES
ncbi:MAG TPA: AarF/ABC1/UbiB kinase family protein [Ktedonobacterales bacterium]